MARLMVNASRVILKETSSDPKPAGPIQSGFNSAALSPFTLPLCNLCSPRLWCQALLYLRPEHIGEATIMEIIRDLLIFVAVMFALCIVLIVVISKMPDDNPLKRILTALSYRLGATLAGGTLAIPIEPIPELDVLYDMAVPDRTYLVLVHVLSGRSCAPRAEELQPPEHRQAKRGSAPTVDN